MANVRRIQKTMDKIMSDLVHWNQDMWGSIPAGDVVSWTTVAGDGPVKAPTCGAAFCMAGHAAILAGHTPLVYPGETTIEYVALKGKLRATLKGQEEPVHVPVIVREWLDLSHDQGNRLFDSANSLVELWTFAFVFTGGKLTIPDYYEGFESGDDYEHGVVNLPETMQLYLNRVRLNGWPDDVYVAYMDDKANLMKRLSKQIERAEKARVERERVEAAHGS